MLIRKPDEFKTQLSFAENFGVISNNTILVEFLIQILASSKCNPEHDYLKLIQDLRAKNPDLRNYEIYAHILYVQQKDPNNPLYAQDIIELLFRELNPEPSKDVEFINQVFYFSVTTYISKDKIDQRWQTVCINLLNNQDVNPSYPIANNQNVSNLVLSFEYIKEEYDHKRLDDYDYKRLSRIEWDTFEMKLDDLKIGWWHSKISRIHFQKIPSLFISMADNYFRQHQTAQKSELKQEDITQVTNSLDRLFYLAVDAARLENDFALLNKFIVFKEQGFTPSYSDGLQQKIVTSFKNWITRAVSSSDGRNPTVGYTERSLFQLLNNHFKTLIPDFIKEIARYSLRTDYEDGYPWHPRRYYHPNDMLLVFRKCLSLKIHKLWYSESPLFALINQHALLILNTLENYILKNIHEFVVNQPWLLFREGTKFVLNNEVFYLPENIVLLIETSRAASKEIKNAHGLLVQYLNTTLAKAVPEGKDADKPKRRSQYVHAFYIALRDEDLNHTVIKYLEKTVTRKMLEPYRQQILFTLEDILQGTMGLNNIRLIYDYADVSEIENKETKPASFKPLGGLQ